MRYSECCGKPDVRTPNFNLDFEGGSLNLYHSRKKILNVTVAGHSPSPSSFTVPGNMPRSPSGMACDGPLQSRSSTFLRPSTQALEKANISDAHSASRY